MKEFVGCILVLTAFVLLRFFFACPKSLWHRFGLILQNVVFYFQQIVYWGLLITGLVLCFLSNIKVGFLALGCFLCFYMMSFAILSLNRIPLLYNELAGLLGIISLVLGLVLSFITSIKYGLIAIGVILLIFLLARCLMHIEIVIRGKRNQTMTDV
ncbi:MAG: hypothetical protein WC476_10750 [Phycisphaerae bacterium]|jgi:hypothetical protein